MTKKSIVLAASLFVTNILLAQTRRPVDYVDPFIGTGTADSVSLSGACFPGATVPFGLVQLSPDTRDNPGRTALPSGYNYNHTTIVGFSHTHLNGTGIGDLYDVLLMPTTGDIRSVPGEPDQPGSGFRSRFSHEQETARPGYYQVKLLDYGIDAELTATEHAGFHRYSYPANSDGHLVIDLNHSLDKKRPYYPCKILGAEIRMIDNKTIEGYRILTGWARLRKVYFRAEFSKSIVSCVFFNGDRRYDKEVLINGTNLRAVLNFALAYVLLCDLPSFMATVWTHF